MFKREHKFDFDCANASVDRHFCRIDFIIAYDCGGFVYLEVDEHQHRFGICQAGGAAVSCDAKRVANVHTSLTIECADRASGVPSIYWLRYNPHAWHVDGQTMRLPGDERLKRLCAFLKRYKPTTAVGIGYAFYDYGVESGLEVLAADQFPAVFAPHAFNLEGLDDAMGPFGREDGDEDTALACTPCEDCL